MENDYWLSRWQENDIPFHEKEVNADLVAYIEQLNLHPGDSVFIPLCGKTRDMLWLAEQGFHVVGVELSAIACRDFFAELNIKPNITKENKFTKYQYKNIELFCGDLFDLTSKDVPRIQAVYDCKALIALPPDLRKKYVGHFVKCCGNKIRILLLTRETNRQVVAPPYPIDEAEINMLYGPYFNVQLLKSQQIEKIPERLINKGYTEMLEAVYLMA